jgi:hypothetical protein
MDDDDGMAWHGMAGADRGKKEDTPMEMRLVVVE